MLSISKSILSVVIKITITIQNLEVYNFQHRPLLFNTLGPAMQNPFYAFREKCFQLGDKPNMHCLLQFMVSGKMTAF
jgi:hypothetical protein